MINFCLCLLDIKLSKMREADCLDDSDEPKFIFIVESSGVGQELIGGADRDRTGDPRLAKPVLSQLSYSPE